MKQIKQEQINEITNFLSKVVVPSEVGASLMAIVQILTTLPEVSKTEDKKVK